MVQLAAEEPEMVASALERLQQTANKIAGRPVDLPALIKKTRMPRLAKYLRRVAQA
jgi:hypothetical protein